MTEPPQGPATGADQAGRLGDRYEVGGLLGRGGMADVRVGRDLRLGRTVAIKRLRNDLASDPTFQARFRREAQSAASLNHPSIVAVYDTGEETGPESQGVPFIVMELVEGQTLREILREDRKILPQRALEITADVLGALDYSHRSGIVHRDIKPANVMLTPAGQVKVMDFGIARAIADSSSAMTQTAAVVGTAQYLSPEQARGEQVDARSDIYSTGCLLYELLAGRPPFVGDSPVSVAYQHVREDPVPPSAANPEVTPGMDAVVMRALAKRTEDRYQSAAEMRSDIERVLAGFDVAQPTVAAAMPPAAAAAPPPDATSTIPAAAGPPSEPPQQERRRRRWPWVLLVMLLVLAIIAGGAYALRDELGFGNNTGSSASDVQVVDVPDLEDMTKRQARRELRGAGLELGQQSRQSSESVDQGLVISSDPGAGEQLEEGQAVDVVLSSGPAKRYVPDVIGDPYSDAVREIQSEGFRSVVPEVNEECTRPADAVCSVRPGGQGNKKLDPSTEITVYYSAGYKQVPQELIGQPRQQVLSMFKRNGFDRGNIEIEHDTSATNEERGTVVDATVEPGEYVDPSESITLTVAKPPKNDSGNNSDDQSEDQGQGPPSEDPSDEPSDDSTDNPGDEESQRNGDPGNDQSQRNGDPDDDLGIL